MVRYYCVQRVCICTQKLNLNFMIFSPQPILPVFYGILLYSYFACLRYYTKRSVSWISRRRSSAYPLTLSLPHVHVALSGGVHELGWALLLKRRLDQNTL